MNTIQLISINHQTHSSDLRISLDIAEQRWNELFLYMRVKCGVEGYIHLSTCNRVEIFYESTSACHQKIIEKWISMVELNEKIDPQSFQVYSGYQDCIEHLLQLSVGFKSAIYGDDQILSQLKKAFEQGRSAGNLSTLIERAYQTIMRSHKQVCRETDFKSQTVSLAYQALKSTRNVFGVQELKEKRMLIIGAGDMAAQVVKYSSKFSFEAIDITNRTRSKAERLVTNKSINVVDYETVNFSDYELIVSCTDQGYNRITDWSGVEYYIDLSLYSSKIDKVAVPYVLLQELQNMIRYQNNLRMESVEKVNGILAKKQKEFTDWCSERMLRSVHFVS